VWQLREAIAKKLSERHGVSVDPSCVLISPGAKVMIFAIIHSLVDPGDEVIYAAPVYPAYEAAVLMAGATPVQVVLDEKREFRFSLDEMARRITPKTKMIVINTPQNPTGGVLTLDDLKGVARLARQHDLLILSDEIYSEIYYDTPTAGMLDVPDIKDRLLLVNGFSKTYAMTGWRVGYSVVPKDLVPTVNLFMNNSVSSTSTFLPARGDRGLYSGNDGDCREDGPGVPQATGCFRGWTQLHTGDPMPETPWRVLSVPEYLEPWPHEQGDCRQAVERSRCRGTSGNGIWLPG
jgi:aspartate/methionine/tyrosine aminotransferase